MTNATLLAVCITLGLAPSAHSLCQVPHFRKGRDFGATVYVSIAPKDFTLNNLVCIGQSLRGRDRKLKNFSLLVFASHDAALNFLPAPIEVQRQWWARWAEQLHAVYMFDAGKHENSLDVYPLGFASDYATSLSTTIKLPTSPRPECKLQSSDRCLMAVLNNIMYPQEALKTGAEGSVTLAATIEPAGNIGSVQVVKADASPAELEDSFVRVALENFKALQFDASEQPNQVRITYSFVIDKSLPLGEESRAEWALPNEVIIRGNSRE